MVKFHPENSQPSFTTCSYLQFQSWADSLTKLLLQRMLLRRCSLWFQSLRLAAVRRNGISARTGRGWLSARDDLTLLFSVQRGSSPRLGRMWRCLPWLGCCPWRWWQSTHKCGSNVKSMMISSFALCTCFNCATSGASALYRTRDAGVPTMLRNGFLRFPMYGECPGYLSLIPKPSRTCHLPRTHNPLWLMRVKMRELGNFQWKPMDVYLQTVFVGSCKHSKS